MKPNKSADKKGGLHMCNPYYPHANYYAVTYYGINYYDLLISSDLFGFTQNKINLKFYLKTKQFQNNIGRAEN